MNTTMTVTFSISVEDVTLALIWDCTLNRRSVEDAKASLATREQVRDRMEALLLASGIGCYTQAPSLDEFKDQKIVKAVTACVKRALKGGSL